MYTIIRNIRIPLLAFFFITYHLVGKTQGLPLNRITYEVYNLETGKFTKLEAKADVKLSTKTIIIKPGQRIEKILATEKINPMDKDVFSILYDLNPDVVRLDSLQVSTSIVIPTLAFIKRPLLANQLLSIRLDDKIKRSILVKNSILLDSLADKDSMRREVVVKKLFDNEETYDLYKESVTLFNQISTAIGERTTLINHEQLQDIDAVGSFLTKLIQSKASPPTKELARIPLVRADLKTWALYFIEQKANGSLPKDNRIEVFFTLKKNGTSTPIKEGYRVFYCAPGLLPDGAHSLGEVGSNISHKIPQANWAFWAKKTPVSNNYPPDTEKIEIFIDSDHKKVDLFLLK